MTKLLKEQMLRVNFTLKEKQDQNQPARKAKATHAAAHYDCNHLEVSTGTL